MSELKLTREQRTAIFAGQHPRITFPGDEDPPVEPGYIHHLSSKVSIEVLAVRETKKGAWRLDYLLKDDRPDLVRRVPPVYTPSADEEELSPEELKRAARESAVTHSPSEAVTDAGELVPEGYQKELTKRSRERWEKHMTTERSDEVAQREMRRLGNRLRRLQVDAAKRGVDITPRLEAMIRAAQEEIGEKAA